MANQNRTAAQVLKDLENTPDGAQERDYLADEFVEKLAEDAPAEQASPVERPRRQGPPRDLQASA